MTEAADDQARQIYAEILGRAPEHDFDPTIDRVASLLDLLGNPQRSFRAIHLTGTNGKTSTARMIEALLRELGLRTGQFTSPHLHTVRERIVIDGEPISAERFVSTWRDIEPYVAMVDAQLSDAGQSRLSFFEVLTALGFAAFADAPVQVAVVEVGMGGLWDSTNTVDGEIAVFSPIARDHERWLGNTVEQIASIKSGIIKSLEPAQVVVTATQPRDAEAILAQVAADHGARVLAQGYDIEVANRTIAIGGQLLDLRGSGGLYTEVFLPLHGEHQADNALLALVAVEQFLGGAALDGSVVEAGFAAVTSPGRLEVIRNSPTVLVDAAHNPAGMQALVDALDEAFAFSRLVGVIGVLADKDAEAMLSVLEPVLPEIVVTEVSSDRAMPAAELADLAREVFGDDRVHLQPSLPDAVALAADLAEQGDDERIGSGTGVIVAGSVILAGQVRALFGAPGQV
ncbi:MAG: bifunctional folylpolyglutamate synthase/dihydrofolate synthase [Beutenbergiaceae bacterium]